MEIRAPLIMSLVLIAAMVVITIWVWPLIPAGTLIAVHWGLDGKPNGYMPRGMGLSIMPAGALLLTLIFALAPSFTKRKAELARSSKPYVAAWIGSLLVILAVHVLMILHTRGVAIDVLGNVFFLLALVFVAVGNLLGKTRPNPLVGVRTPWTRQSAYAWEKTNRAFGRMMVGTGLATLVCFAAANGRIAGIVFVAISVTIAVISIPMSYYYYRRDPERKALY